MKIRSGFVSNSSSSSFIIKFDPDKNVSINMPLSVLLRLLDVDYSYNINKDKEFTEEDLGEKESSVLWKINKENKTVKGIFRKNGDCPNTIEKTIDQLYDGIDQFFKVNNIRIEEYHEI